jgi:hypothetical protein
MDARYVELANRIGLGQSNRIAGLFGMIADAAEADLLLALPGNAPAMAEKLGRPEDEITGMLHTLFIKGLVFPSKKTDPPTYKMCRDLQFHDAPILWPDAPGVLDLWADFMDVEWPDVAKVFIARWFPAVHSESFLWALRFRPRPTCWP